MNENEFRQLVLTQRDRLYTYAAWSLGELESAKDACQEAYTRLWQHHRNVHPAAGRSWLFQAVHRLCIDQHRDRARRSALPLEELIEPARSEPGDDGCPPDIRLVVANGLARLSSADRALLVLRELIGMPIREIGRITGRPENNVSVALHRARRRLRSELIKVYGEDGP